jgi:hypothetical protein
MDIKPCSKAPGGLRNPETRTRIPDIQNYLHGYTSTAVHPSQLPPVRTHVQVKPSSGLERAIVKWFNRTKGFGFLTRGEGTEDIFIHMETLGATGWRSCGLDRWCWCASAMAKKA